MYKRAAHLLIALILFLSGQAQAQGQGSFEEIAKCFTALSDFDYRFPRETVYLHLDNNGYFEGETLWFKAYVMRASSLCPQPVSRVLYVELLDADGELVERKLLPIDSLGQTDGAFKLELPVRGGNFYEVRAFTREMLNWGGEACFSRVVPVFKKKDLEAEPGSNMEILRPRHEADLNHGHPRPYDFKRNKNWQLTFYPEGGSRVSGLAGRIAYELTESDGTPGNDTISIYNAEGTALLTTVPIHERRGVFTLPAGIDKAYAIVRGKRFDLPAVAPEARYALTARMNGDLDLIVQRRADAVPELLGLAVMCRDEAVYFDTLTVGNAPVELTIGRKLLGDGVNRVELFDSRGQSLARRLVWGPPTARRVTIDLRQNEAAYKPFSPIALEMSLKDAYGKPVQTTFSLAVREAAAEVVAAPEVDLAAELLLCSELRGYVADPAWYFASDDRHRRDALDVLLMVQGWTANRFEVMAGLDSFSLRYPVEDRLILQGRVLRNNNREQARAGTSINLIMFNKAGYSMRSTAVTDSLGGFVFGASTDYTGDWIAQFTTRVNDKPVWSRVALDRWFCPSPRAIDDREMDIHSPRPAIEETTAETFVWNDTLPPASISENIGTAVVTYRGYRGLRGNKYSYLGGEREGMRRATSYYNFELLVEREKDRGGAPGLIWDVLREKDDAFDYSTALDTNDRQYMNFLEGLGDTAGNIPSPEVYMFRYAGRPAIVFVDNELFLQRYKGDNPIIFADEVKSVVIMREPSAWRDFLTMASGTANNVEGMNPAAIFLYTRPDYTFFRSKKGVEKRTIHGFEEPVAFYNPDYRSIDVPTVEDKRRTLYWNPSLKSDEQGKASVVFFSNSHAEQKLSFSARGVTARGGLLYLETQ